jgi:hypothetical protein
MLQKQAQEAYQPVSDRLALLHAQYSENASDNLIVELLLVKVLAHLVSAFLSTLFACLWWLETTSFLNLS